MNYVDRILNLLSLHQKWTHCWYLRLTSKNRLPRFVVSLKFVFETDLVEMRVQYFYSVIKVN